MALAPQKLELAFLWALFHKSNLMLALCSCTSSFRRREIFLVPEEIRAGFLKSFHQMTILSPVSKNMNRTTHFEILSPHNINHGYVQFNVPLQLFDTQLFRVYFNYWQSSRFNWINYNYRTWGYRYDVMQVPNETNAMLSLNYKIIINNNWSEREMQWKKKQTKIFLMDKTNVMMSHMSSLRN